MLAANTGNRFAQLLFATLQSAIRPPAVTFTAVPGQPTRTVSAPFKLGGFGNGRATVRTETNLSDRWMSMDMQLVEADTGRAYGLKRSVGFQNVGGSLDGSPNDVAEVRVPSGRYTLAIDAPIDQATLRLEEDGTYRQIYQRWFGSDPN